MEWFNLSTKSNNPCSEIEIGPTQSYTFGIQNIPTGFTNIHWNTTSYEPYVHSLRAPATFSCALCEIEVGSFVNVVSAFDMNFHGLAEYVGCTGPVLWLGNPEHWACVQILNGGKLHGKLREIPADNIKRL